MVTSGRRRVEHRRQRAHERSQQPRHHEPANPDGEKDTDEGGQRLVGSRQLQLAPLRQGVRDDPRNDEDEQRQQLEEAGEDRARAGRCPRRADSTRWTMNWSVHQYQTPRIGAPNRMPVHGKSGSDIGFHMSKKLGADGGLGSSPQPPSCAEAEHGHGHRPADEHEHLQQVGVEHRPQAAEDRVDAGGSPPPARRSRSRCPSATRRRCRRRRWSPRSWSGRSRRWR